MASIYTEVTTPETNPDYDAGVSERAKRRVQEVDYHNGRCLVLNNQLAIEYCHCIARKNMKNLQLVCCLFSYLFSYLFLAQIYLASKT